MRLCMWPGYRGFLSQGCLVYLVYFVSLVELDKPNQPDELNKPDRPVLKILLTSRVLNFYTHDVIVSYADRCPLPLFTQASI